MMKFYWRHTAAWIGFTVLTVNFAFADDAAFPQRFADLRACETMSGTSIADCRIGYRTAGTLNEDRSNAVLVPTWFRGISEGLLFLANPEAIDPSTYFIIFADGAIKLSFHISCVLQLKILNVTSGLVSVP